MQAYALKAVQKLPSTLPQVWSFFSNPANLASITPPYMGFHVISHHHGDTMYAGQIIEYTVKPLLGISLYWMTEITQVKDQAYFVDEQRYGPYGLWHHQHHFKEIIGGVEMTDIVHYKLPLGILGRAAHGLFVRRQLEQIFTYRYEQSVGRLGEWKGERQSLLFS